MTTHFKRIVIKVGTSTLTDDRGLIDRAYLASLAGQIADLKSQGSDVLLVTSGAIRAGMESLGLTRRPKTIPENQAAAAVGQGLLMQTYSDVFRQLGLTVGQVLLTKEDFRERMRYLNARNTMLALFRHGVVPIVNENDTVAVDEIKVGDNDMLAALVASNIEANLLVLLSDVPGLYDAHPGKAESARLIPVVAKIDESIRAMAGGTQGLSGTGGMRTKIEAAEIATRCGVTMVIADGRRSNVLNEIVQGDGVGTTFLPTKKSLSGRQRWMAFGAAPKGGVVVNEGAKKMIREKGTSLLAAGITDVVGRFSSGDVVRILDKDGNQIARGFVNYSADDIEKIKGKRSGDIESILGHKDYDEVVHRDNMVLQG